MKKEDNRIHTLIDTHAHLYDGQYSQDLEAVIVRCQAQGVQKIYMPNLELETIEPMLALEKRYPDLCQSMIGLHPCSVVEDYALKLSTMQAWLGRHPFVAIGEVGLDFYHSTTHRTQQIKALEAQIEWAIDYQLPLVLHARNSLNEVIDIVKSAPLPPGIFHCFSGTMAQAESILAMGYFLGLGGLITYGNHALEEVIRNIPLKHCVLETDAPYLSPPPYRGKRNDPSLLPYIAAKLAALQDCSIEEVCKITTQNAKKILGRQER